MTSIAKLGRLELLRYLNEFLEADYAKIEELRDGTAFAQILDACYPGKFPLNRINFTPHTVDENVRNLKILDQAFRALAIQKEIPFQKLAAGNFQENLEFLQWCLQHQARVNPQARERYAAYARRVEAHEQRAKRIASAAVGASTPMNRRQSVQGRANARGAHDELAGYYDDDDLFFAADVGAQQAPSRGGSSAAAAAATSAAAAAAAAAVPASVRRSGAHSGWVNGGSQNNSSAYLHHEPPPTPSSQALLLMQQAPADQVDDEQTWLKKRAELEELMVSLHSDLQYRLQAQQETVDSLLAMKRERDLYLAKVVALERLCARFSKRTLIADEIARVLLEPTPLDAGIVSSDDAADDAVSRAHHA